MLFQRYASPMVIVDKMILTGRFSEFVQEFVTIRNKELIDQTRWEFWLHKVFNMSFDEYLGAAENNAGNEEVLSADEMKETVKDSLGIIKDFCPS